MPLLRKPFRFALALAQNKPIKYTSHDALRGFTMITVSMKNIIGYVKRCYYRLRYIKLIC